MQPLRGTGGPGDGPAVIAGDSRAVASVGNSAGAVRMKVVNAWVGRYVTGLDKDSFETAADGEGPCRITELVGAARIRAAEPLVEAMPVGPDDPAHRSAWQALLPRIESLAAHSDPQADDTSSIEVFTGAGLFLLGQGAANRSIDYLQRALDFCHRVLGADHPRTPNASWGPTSPGRRTPATASVAHSGRPARSPERSRTSSAPSPTATASSEPTTPTRWSAATAWPTPTWRPGTTTDWPAS